MQSIWQIVDRLCCGLSINSLLASEPDIIETQAAPKKDWFLYLMTNQAISRLNIDEFCKRGKTSDEKTELELMHDYRHCDPSSKLPLNMEHIRVGSKVQMWYHRDDKEFEDGVHYCFDPIDPDGLSIRQCDNCNDSDLLHKASFTLDDKVYSFYPYFEVFDPLHQLWKRLLPVPTGQFEKIYAVGHKLVFQSSQRRSYMFDAIQGKWEDWPERSEQTVTYMDGEYSYSYSRMIDIWSSNGMQAAVEHEGFIIAPLHCGNRLAAFQWDSDGVLKMYRVLSELDPIVFDDTGELLMISSQSSSAMGKCDDGGRMWLVYNGFDAEQKWYMRIGVFRVSVSNNLDGRRPVVSAQIEAKALFPVEGSTSIKSAFALCHQPNSHPSQHTLAS